MANSIIIKKAINGYILTTGWEHSSDNVILFKDMDEVCKHLEECFVKPFKNLVYVTKIKDNA